MREENKKNNKETADLKDLIIIFSIIIAILVASSMFDLFGMIRILAIEQEAFRIIETLFVIAVFSLAYAVFSRRRSKESKFDIKDLEAAIEELQDNVNRLKITVDLSPDAIVVHREGKIIFINKAGLNLLRAESEEQVIGKLVKDFTHYSYWEAVSQRLEGMSKYMKQFPPIDLTVKRLDSTYLEVSVSSTPVLYHSIPHIITIIRDISERKRNEEIKSRLASIVLTSNDAIYAVNLDGIITSWNPGAEKLYGYTEREAIGSNSTTIITPEKRAEMNFLLNKISKGEQVESFETRRVKKDKSVIDVSLTISPIMDDSGIITQASIIARDITFKKQVEEELRRYAEELAMSNEELYVFSYAASHDLQEPLRSIQQFIETLVRKYKRKLGPEMEEQITSANDGVTRMHRLITDFLMYSRVGTERAPREEIDCNIILKNAISNLDAAIRESKASIKQFTLPKLYANEIQLTQLFQNLIANAIKYQGESTPAIEIFAEKKDNKWQFGVKDNGIGIEQWFSERIFIVFQKLHDHKKYPGSGIGLALCKRVVEKHGGKIWFESEVGKGTTFFFTFPVIGSDKEKVKIKKK